MREIKFRAWGWDTKYPDYEIKDCLMEVEAINWEEKTVTVPYKDGSKSRVGPMDEFIIEQFTGLHDKNGKEIYEGDIVHVEYAKWIWDAIVEWDTVNPCFVLANIVKGDFPEHEYDFNKCDQMEITVTGNIHEEEQK